MRTATTPRTCGAIPCSRWRSTVRRRIGSSVRSPPSRVWRTGPTCDRCCGWGGRWSTCTGIRTFKPMLRRAPEHLDAVRTPEGAPVPVNTLAELRRDLARLHLIRAQIKAIEATRLERLQQAPDQGPHAMVRLLARGIGIGVETADMLVQEVLWRNLRGRRAVARYAGLTGAPDESGAKRREQGLARAGNGRVRRGMIQRAWRFLMFQSESALAQWFRSRTAQAPKMRKTMIVALARKLLIAVWRLVHTGAVPEGLALRPAV